MEYFNSAGGGTSNAPDPYAVIPQQFGNGGLPPPQSAQNNAPDYETYQQQQAAAQAAAAAAQQQQYRAQQAAQQQQSPTIYYQNQMAAAPGSYFPIHSASEHDYLADFLGPQHPPTGTSSGAVGGAAGAPYQTAVTNKDFIMQHQLFQQRRGNQSGQQQQNQSQNQSGRQQSQQQMMGGTSNSAAVQQQYMHQHIQQQHAAAQQMHRLQGAPINPQQFMVPPPAILQSAQIQGGGGGQQQQQVQQMHQMQMQQHSQMMQQAGGGYHPQPQQQQQGQGHHHQQGHHGQHHHQNQHAQHQMMPRLPMLKDWPIRCVVEGKYQSVILGTNGSTIREIAHSTHCRVEFVNLSKRERGVLGNNDRVLTVHGHGEQASKAVARILEVIQVEALKDDENVGADIVLRLRAHNQLCGRLIGKLGSSIKEIMNKTGTNITVAKYIEPVGGLGGLRQDEMLSLMERTIVIRGPSIEAVVQAESLISAKLKKCYDSDSQTRAQQNSGGPLPPMPMIHGPPGGSPNAINPPALIPTPQGVIQFQHFQPSHHPATPANSFLQPGMLRIPPGVTTLRQVRMWVPDNMIGALIGAKGKNIKMIIRESHANVKIEAPEEKIQREAEEAEKKKKREEKANEETGENANAAGDHQEFLEDSETVTSADAIEKETPPSDRLVTINGDDVQLLKAQSFVFTKIAETNTNFPAGANEFERLFVNRIRTEVSVPTRIIGRIIGRGGQNVRELQRITAAVVKIPEDERPGELVQAEGVEEEMTLIRIYGNMLSTHNVQFRLSNLISDYYRSGEHRQKNVSGDQQQQQQQHGVRVQPQSAPHSESASPLNQMGQLGQVPPISTSSNRTSPQSATSPNSKSP